MNEKITLLKDLEYNADIETVMSMLIEASKKRDTPQLKTMAEAVNRIYFYVHNLREERKMYNKAMSQYSADKCRAVERARMAEKKTEELEEKLKKYNIFGDK